MLTFRYWKEDFPAALVVFLVAVPLCLGIAHASNMPLLSGLLAGLVGGLVIGLLSQSSLSVGGPTAGLTAIIAAAFGHLGSIEAVYAAIVLAGIFQMIGGVLRVGTVARYVPTVVIEGMLVAIGLMLIFKQIPHFIGYDMEAEGLEQFSLPELHSNTFSFFWHSLHRVHFSIFAIGLLAVAIILFWDRIIGLRLGPKYPLIKTIHRLIPGSLIAVVVSGILGLSFNVLPLHLVQIPVLNSAQDFLSQMRFPDFGVLSHLAVYKTALLIAFVASIEGLLCVEAVDKIDPARRHTSLRREMFAQGCGNIVSGLLGGLPVTSVVVRSSVNVSAGARSSLSTISHGVLILFSVVFLSEFLNCVPLTTLAAILLVTGYKLANPAVFKRLYKEGRDQFIPFCATVIAILLTNLMIGVLIGIGVSAIFILRNHYASEVITVANRGLFTEIILGENLTFLNKQRIMEILDAIPSHAKVLINGEKVRYMDHDILQSLREFARNAHFQKIEVLIGGIPQMSSDDKLTQEFRNSYENLLSNNRSWVAEKERREGAHFFKDLAEGQSPQFLFVGCSDSRVPIEVLTKAEPGDIFVHRNIANTVSLTDANFLSVLEYAVKVLRVKNIVVCGHYECGGVKAALSGDVEGIIGHWISQIKDVYRLYAQELDNISDPHLREQRLIEYHVVEQVKKIQKTLLVQNALKTFGFPQLHGWVYDIHTGLIKELPIQ